MHDHSVNSQTRVRNMRHQIVRDDDIHFISIQQHTDIYICTYITDVYAVYLSSCYSCPVAILFWYECHWIKISLGTQ